MEWCVDSTFRQSKIFHFWSPFPPAYPNLCPCFAHLRFISSSFPSLWGFLLSCSFIRIRPPPTQNIPALRQTWVTIPSALTSEIGTCKAICQFTWVFSEWLSELSSEYLLAILEAVVCSHLLIYRVHGNSLSPGSVVGIAPGFLLLLYLSVFMVGVGAGREDPIIRLLPLSESA